MSKDFGLTWWGQKWLESLTKIDYENRIPRGARYARNGSVLSVKFDKEGTIKARVQGTRATPYSIKITIPQFDDKQKNDLVDAVMASPSLVAGLLNRELGEEILAIADRLKMKVFPSSWRDLGMNCSCPDWAVPCKHIAAVIYKLSQEIDNDPFLVFTMHGLDLLQAIESRNVHLDSSQIMSVQPTKEFLTIHKGKSTACAEWNPDMSRLRNLTDTLVDILDVTCPFETGFRERYRTSLKKCQRALSKNILEDKIMPSRGAEVRMSISEDFVPVFEITDTEIPDPKIANVGDMITMLKSIEGEELNICQPSMLLFRNACALAETLVLKGCVTPQITVCGKDYRIIWLPATADSEVKRLVEGLESALDRRLVLDGQGKPLQEAARVLLTTFITNTINNNSQSTNRLADFFFRGKTETFKGIGEKSIPGGIKSYLACFHIPATDEVPMLHVYDSGKGFELEFGYEIKGKEIPLDKILSGKKYEEQRFALLQRLSLIMRFVPGASVYVDSGAKERIEMTDSDFSTILTSTLPSIRLLNAKVIVPVSLEQLLRPKPSLGIKKRPTASVKSFIRVDDLLDFDWKVAIGDELIEESVFDRLVKDARGLIRFKNNFFYVDDDDLRKIYDAMADAKGPGRMRILQAAISGEYEGTQVRLTDEVRMLINELTRIGEERVPETVCAQLRPYQVRGYSWMYKNLMLGFGSIIADDMGLGKTLQVITLLARMKGEGALDKRKALIVVPTGLISNWESELDRFSPSLTHFRYHGQERNLTAFDADIMITTYGVLRSDAKELAKLKWEIEIIDEAQNIKNTDTAQTKAVKSIPAETKLAMSGTPVENRLTEYWSIMDFVNKGYLDTKKEFVKRFAQPIEVEGSTAVSERFRRVTAPFMMRRLKSDKSIITDLPDKVTRNFSPALTTSQAALYQQVVEEYMKTLEGCPTEDAKSLFKRQGIVLQMILALKQICNHPALFLKDGKEASELSGKCEMLTELVRSIVESNEKVLIFTQFREMGEILQQTLNDALGFKPLFYHGGCTLKERNDMTRRFQEVRSDQVFILSLKAAGTGLNLTAASHVIHFDLWWNPAVEAQATDRAYRIGQHKNVLVTRFVTEGTFEERIDKMLTEKKHLSDITVASGESWIGNLSNKELRELVALENRNSVLP